MTAVTLGAIILVAQLSHPSGSALEKYKNYLVRTVNLYWGARGDVSIFAAQIRQESNWRPFARSPHAVGLTQFTRPTARWISERYTSLSAGVPAGADMRLDWKWSIRAMVLYDRHLYERLSSGRSAALSGISVWELTLRAYNGGLGWINRELAMCKILDFACCRRFRARSSCEENLDYPQKILFKWKPLYEAWNR